jgi:peptidyl-prolyl cis-trans isomerase A (cyclophilin A)
VRRGVTIMLALSLTVALTACGGGSSSKSSPPPALLHPDKLTTKAPQLFDVKFETTKGTFTVSVHRTWAPHGADRFYNLVKAHFFDGAKFFRVVPGFVVQFGISPYPEVSKAWQSATIPGDQVAAHNSRGAFDFASAGPNTRTTQVFVDLGDNAFLDGNGFAPIGSVTQGMDVLDKLYSGYKEQPTPHQGEMQSQGNAWLEQHYPKLDSIKSATITSESNPALP